MITVTLFCLLGKNYRTTLCPKYKKIRLIVVHQSVQLIMTSKLLKMSLVEMHGLIIAQPTSGINSNHLQPHQTR